MIIQCEECKHDISDEAPCCPHCGIKRVTKSEALQNEAYRRHLKDQRNKKIILFAIWGILGAGWLYTKINPPTSSDVNNIQNESALSQADINSGKGFPAVPACNYLSSMEGYTPNKYKTSSPDTTDYMCGTPYKNIGEDSNTLLPNNIAYYVSGSNADVADTIKIIVNINQPKYAKQAREELSKAVRQLFLSAFEKSPPDNIVKQISSGKVGSWTYGSHVITFKKIKWQSGKGFEYNFTINTIEYNFTSKNQ